MSRYFFAIRTKRLLISGVAFLILSSLFKTFPVLSQDYDSDLSDEISLLSDQKPESGISPIEQLGLTGSLRGGYWSSNRLNSTENDFVSNSLWLKLDKRLRRGVTLYSEAYVYSEDVLGEKSSDGQLKELYVHLRSGDWDYRLGRQIVAWGRTDRLNPTDNLTPRDLTLLSPEIDEDRLGVEAIKVSKIFGSYSSIIGIWIAEFEPNNLPPANSPGLQVREDIPKTRGQYALKFDQSGGDIDWSISYFNGVDLNADLAVVGLVGSSLLASKTYNDVEIFGADVATIKGSNRYAAEVAFTKTEDSTGNDPSVKNNSIYSVFGLERDFGDNLSVTSQLFYRYVSDYEDPRQIADLGIRSVATLSALANNQLDQDEYGLSIRVGKSWFNETLDLEVSGANLLVRHGYLIRPKLTYAINDEIKATAGFEYFRGGPDTLFGLQESNKLFFSELRYYF